MKELVLVIWIIGFPLGCALERYINRACGYSEKTLAKEEGGYILIPFAIWIFMWIYLI